MIKGFIGMFYGGGKAEEREKVEKPKVIYRVKNMVGGSCGD